MRSTFHSCSPVVRPCFYARRKSVELQRFATILACAPVTILSSPFHSCGPSAPSLSPYNTSVGTVIGLAGLVALHRKSTKLEYQKCNVDCC